MRKPPIHCRRHGHGHGHGHGRGRVVDLDSNIHYEYFIYKRLIANTKKHAVHYIHCQQKIAKALRPSLQEHYALHCNRTTSFIASSLRL